MKRSLQEMADDNQRLKDAAMQGDVAALDRLRQLGLIDVSSKKKLRHFENTRNRLLASQSSNVDAPTRMVKLLNTTAQSAAGRIIIIQIVKFSFFVFMQSHSIVKTKYVKADSVSSYVRYRQLPDSDSCCACVFSTTATPTPFRRATSTTDTAVPGSLPRSTGRPKSTDRNPLLRCARESPHRHDARPRCD